MDTPSNVSGSFEDFDGDVTVLAHFNTLLPVCSPCSVLPPMFYRATEVRNSYCKVGLNMP